MAGGVNTSQERIELTLVDKISAGIAGVRSQISGLTAGMNTLEKAAAAVGVTLGAGAMIAFAKNIVATQAALDDMSASVGASVENLSAIQRVARIGGHDFEGLTGQLGRMIKGLRDQNDEGALAVQAFEKLNIKVRDSNGQFRDSGELLIELARKLGEYRDSGSKTLLVQDALGKGAEKYLPLLNDIAKGTDLLATTTTKQAEEANEAEKAMRRLGIVYEDSAKVLINEFLPSLTRFLEQMSEGIRLTGSFGGALVEFGTMNPFKTPAEHISSLNQELENLRAGRAQMASMPGYEAAVGNVDRQILSAERRKKFAQFLQRQDALSLVDTSNMDARDIRARTGTKNLDYEGDQAKARAAALKEDEFREAKRLELAEMTATDEREAWAFYYKFREDAEKKVQADIEFRAQKELEYAQMVADDETGAWAAYYATREGQAQLHYDDLHAALVSARERGLITEEEYNEKERKLKQAHQDKITRIDEIGITDRMKFERMTTKEQASYVLDELTSLTAGVAQHNKTMFRINKMASLARAVINTYEGVTKSLATYPMPLAAVMAGIHLAAGIAQVSAIQATTFEGGGSGIAPSVAGTAAAAPVSPVQQDTRPSQTTIVNFQGTTDESKLIRRFVDMLNENNRDGGRIIVGGMA